MCDLEDGPQSLVAFLALVCSSFRVFHLVLEFEQGVFDVVKAFWWRFLVAACASDGGHGSNFL